MQKLWSALKVSPLSLGTMMFGQQTPDATAKSRIRDNVLYEAGDIGRGTEPSWTSRSM
jgi:aryl-alcohol dehydrogenase-like predicted oxidoreductase